MVKIWPKRTSGGYTAPAYCKHLVTELTLDPRFSAMTLALVVVQACISDNYERAATVVIMQAILCIKEPLLTTSLISSLRLFSLASACLLRRTMLCLMVEWLEIHSRAFSLHVLDRWHSLRSFDTMSFRQRF